MDSRPAWGRSASHPGRRTIRAGPDAIQLSHRRHEPGVRPHWSWCYGSSCSYSLAASDSGLQWRGQVIPERKGPQTPPVAPTVISMEETTSSWRGGGWRGEETNSASSEKQFAGKVLIHPSTANRDIRSAFISPMNTIQKQLSIRGKEQ